MGMKKSLIKIDLRMTHQQGMEKDNCHCMIFVIDYCKLGQGPHLFTKNRAQEVRCSVGACGPILFFYRRRQIPLQMKFRVGRNKIQGFATYLQ